ncbi:MAG: acetylglutamate kinase [bacterium]|nr:acetylglutamate kinase [bacterium]
MNNKQKDYYLSKFRENTFVIKIGGEVISSKKILENILKDIKKLFDYGIHVVLVHGGGTQADKISADLGHIPQKINGRRITTKKDIEIVKMLYGGSVNLEILSIMKKLKMKGIRVSGLDGDLLHAKKRKTKDINYGYVGDIESVNTQILHDLLEKRYLPIISPLAVTNTGTILNINADTIATEVAIKLKADKLILFTNMDGIIKKGKLVSSITTTEAQKLIDEGTVKDGMSVKTHNCIKAAKNGVKRVHILNGLSPHSLLTEVLTKKGTGTLITSAKEKKIYLNEEV